MIQIKRGKTDSWRKNAVKLADGQPGYDKDKHKIKIGDGESTWEKLPYASGLSEEEILCSEKEAKLSLLADPENKAIITYGTDNPDKKTVGQLYLQYYDAEPEVDYVVEYGVDGIWTYRKWNSGLAECWGTTKITTTVDTPLDETKLYSSSSMKKIKYPFAFKTVDSKISPSELASIHAPGSIVWLAVKEANSATTTAAYSIICPYKQHTAGNYYITIRAEGFWK